MIFIVGSVGIGIIVGWFMGKRYNLYDYYIDQGLDYPKSWDSFIFNIVYKIRGN